MRLNCHVHQGSVLGMACLGILLLTNGSHKGGPSVAFKQQRRNLGVLFGWRIEFWGSSGLSIHLSTKTCIV